MGKNHVRPSRLPSPDLRILISGKQSDPEPTPSSSLVLPRALIFPGRRRQPRRLRRVRRQPRRVPRGPARGGQDGRQGGPPTRYQEGGEGAPRGPHAEEGRGRAYGVRRGGGTERADESEEVRWAGGDAGLRSGSAGDSQAGWSVEWAVGRASWSIKECLVTWHMDD